MNEKGERTKPFPRRNAQMPEPLPVLDPFLTDEPSLKRNELLVRSLYAFRSFRDFLDKFPLPATMSESEVNLPIIEV